MKIEIALKCPVCSGIKIKKMAKKYGADNFTGAKYKVDTSGVFTGEVIPMWDGKSKKKAIDRFCKEYNIDLSKSFAYGDTTGDFTMFKQVGNAVAINPARRLLLKIKKDKELMKKVTVVVERKDVIYKLDSNVEIL